MITYADADLSTVVPRLVDIGKLDTLHRDVYLGRARMLLGPTLSLADYRRRLEVSAQADLLPVRIQRAVERGSWAEVKELSATLHAVHADAVAHRGLMDLARQVYAPTDVVVDPFSPGLQGFSTFPGTRLAAVRDRGLELLARLQSEDAEWSEFYAGRRRALQGAPVAAPEPARMSAGVAGASPADVRAAALQALRSGNLAALQTLADAALAGPATSTGERAGEAPGTPPVKAAATADLLVAFSDDTLKRARDLGLVPRRLAPRPEIASLRDHAWNPVFSDETGHVDAGTIALPAGTPEAMRERLEMYMIHPLVNSGGARHLPALAGEDVLVEDFPEPPEGKDAPASPLLTALGLAGRRGVPRTRIEQALLDHGAGLLERELGLDPRVFRLVCIPPDVHLRLGEAEGWGRQPLWTHFDGYLVMRDGRLRALAGGNARFGGIYDLVGIGRDYDGDTVIVRFAVVRRARMACW